MSRVAPVTVEKEMQRLLHRALLLSDADTLVRLGELLTYLSEGADLLDYAIDVPEGLEDKPVFKRMLLSRQLLEKDPLGHA
jgi:hypothetical protein